MHKPVLVSEVLEFLDPQNGEFFIDATAGAGGHTKAILEKLGKDGKIIAIEWNKHSADLLKSNLENTNNLEIICGNYADIPEIITEKKILGGKRVLLKNFYPNLFSEEGRNVFSLIESKKKQEWWFQ